MKRVSSEYSARALNELFTAEAQRAQGKRRENAEEFYKNVNDSLRFLCALCASAVNTRNKSPDYDRSKYNY